MPKTVLVIDDERDLIDLLQYNLGKEGFKVETCSDGRSGLAAARTRRPDAIVLDVMMPGMDGFEVCKSLKQDQSTRNIPVVMLTARAEESDKVVGLELGADDYVTKPFGVRELVARLKAVLRRADGPAEEDDMQALLELGPLKIDCGQHRVHSGKREVSLTLTEFNILASLVRRRGQVMSRDDLITAARGEDVMVSDRTIDVHMASLRKKLGRSGRLIETVRGRGYRVKA